MTALMERLAETTKKVGGKKYWGKRTSSGGPQSVWVDEDGATRLLTHRMRHSPDGFQWGYGGSGPADLARSILWDALGYEPQVALYQAFKFEFVAVWGSEWEIKAERVIEYATEYYEAWGE